MFPLEETKTLVARSQQGDLEAFEQLVLLYQKKVYALSFNLTGNQVEAQDLAQEAFLRAFTSLKGFRNDADFGTWLHRLTVNLWINGQQRQKKQFFLLPGSFGSAEGEEFPREVAAAGGDPQEALEKEEFRIAMRQALNELPWMQKTALVLREIEGYSYEEIARMLGCSVGTVKSRLNRGRRTLKEKLTFFFNGSPALEGKEF